jgi:hypothetical protein
VRQHAADVDHGTLVTADNHVAGDGLGDEVEGAGDRLVPVVVILAVVQE